MFEKLSCTAEILIWSDAVDFTYDSLGKQFSVVTAQQGCCTDGVKFPDTTWQ